MVGTRAERDGITVLEEREALSEERTLQQKLPVRPVCDPALRKFPGGGNSKLEVLGKDSDWWSRSRWQSGRRGGHTGVLLSWVPSTRRQWSSCERSPWGPVKHPGVDQ